MPTDKSALVRDYYARLDTARRIPAALCTREMRTHFGAVASLTIDEADELGAPFYAAFSGLRHRVVAQIGAGDEVASRLVLEGVHAAPLNGIVARAAQIRVPAMAMHRFEGDRIAEQWIVTDLAALFAQIDAPTARAG